MTASGTAHATRTTSLPLPHQHAPHCMNNRTTQKLRLLLPTRHPITCQRCPSS
ncbi:hypothetical protein [Streptomyces sp. NPDC002082]|uniref:hypothetical protein n=1 Tax=Streptomyces sp. NPDC002082 TaxID=3154772 RepID=UPI00331E9026